MSQNRAVFKYQLNVGINYIPMPAGAQILSVGVQDGVFMQMWAAVDPSSGLNETRHIIVLPTGQISPYALGRFIGSISIYEGQEMFHAFEFQL